MPKYKIPCNWRSYGFYEIEAEDITKALEIVEDSPLPKDQDFIEGSFEVDVEMIGFYNNLSELDKNKIYKF